jgi:hypothetical protein
MFDVPAGFYRRAKKLDYKGHGFFKNKGRILDSGLLYNFSNYKSYDWKNYFLYNFVFGFFRDHLLELRIKEPKYMNIPN